MFKIKNISKKKRMGQKNKPTRGRTKNNLYRINHGKARKYS